MAIADFEEINRPCCFVQRFPTAAASVTGIEFKVLPQNPLIPSVREKVVGFHGPKLPRKLPQALLNFSSTDVYPHSDFHESKKSPPPPPSLVSFGEENNRSKKLNSWNNVLYILWLTHLSFTLVTVSRARRAFSVFWKYFSTTLEMWMWLCGCGCYSCHNNWGTALNTCT